MGTGKTAPTQDEIKKSLGELVSQGKIKGFKLGRSEKYLDSSFPVPLPERRVAPAGKTLGIVADELEILIENSGTKLLSVTAMKKKVGSTGKDLVEDALALLVSRAVLIKLSFGASKLYLHQKIATAFWPTATPIRPVQGPLKPPQNLTAAQVLPVYERLKKEQHGIDTVLIYDLMTALKVPKEPLHNFIKSEMKAGRAFIHPSTSLSIPNEAIDYGILLEGDPYVQVAVVFREKR
jgi:hypothetical protein